MPVAGALAVHVGSRRATRLSFLLSCLTTGVVALAPSLGVLAMLALLLGVAMGSLDVTMNVHGVAVERRYDRPILSSFHAGFSFGGLLGAAVAAVVASAGLDVRLHLVAVAVLSGVVGLAWSQRFLPGSEDATAHREPVFRRPPRRLWSLGALAFACLLIEGAAADWSGVYLDDELDTGGGFAALGFTAFSITMTLGRVFGDRLVRHFGARRLVRAGGAIAAGGFGAALLIGTPAAALVGFACLGAGMSSVVPIVFRSAGEAPGIATGVAVAAVSTIGYMGFVVGPPLIGGIAELSGLPAALGLLVLLGGAVSALATAVAVREPHSAAEPKVVPA